MAATTASQSGLDSELGDLADLNRDYIDSVQSADVGRFEELLADDFLCSNPDGSLVAREAFLEQTAKPVAIIHARTTYTLPDGREAAGRYTDVWARRDGRWLAVSAHVTRA